MNHRNLLSLIVLLLGSYSAAQGQETLSAPNKFADRMKRIFSETDTTYIAPNRYNLTFMIEQSFWYEHYRLGVRTEKQRQNISFAPIPTPKLGFYFGWRWIFLGFSFSLKDLIGKNKHDEQKKEYVFNLYSSRFGVDLYYRKTGSDFRINSYSGFELPDDYYTGQKFEGFQSKIIGMDAYWIFNNRHFSYPAAYSQSTNQRRSCGSLMAGVSYSNHAISFDYTKLPPAMIEQIGSPLRFKSLSYRDMNISLGYGYNWVFAKNCLANLSLMPAIAYKRAQMGSDMGKTKKINDLDFDLITRAGITWNNGKYYVGASLIMNTYDYRKDHFYLTNSFGSLRIYAGFNFWKRRQQESLTTPVR